MSTPFYSSEIRWFSKDPSYLKKLYDALSGKGKQEKERTDYYLKGTGSDIGIKIREGKHEIKHLCGNREVIKDLGTIEHWAKWSTSEENDILNTIEEKRLASWVPIVKSRFKKKYGIHPATGSLVYTKGFPDDGCGVEYTKISMGKEEWYTFGIEAFGAYQSSRKNLLDAVKHLGIKTDYRPDIYCVGYPEFILNKVK